MLDICCIGHITKDTVITPEVTKEMAGGTSFYFSYALSQLPVKYVLFTQASKGQEAIVAQLKADGIEVYAQSSERTLHFENMYGESPDSRTQRVLESADAFSIGQVLGVQSRMFHLGPLLSRDISVEYIRTLAKQGPVSLDIQGYLRALKGTSVVPVEWAEARKALPYIHTLKADDAELAVLTGNADLHEGARVAAGWGVQEVVITLASRGSVLYDGMRFYEIPAYHPGKVVDTTGCGDTYMAGYLFGRVKGMDMEGAGHFASAMSALKTLVAGPFVGTEQEIRRLFSGAPLSSQAQP
jgi:sugar/nucleoside kinase (ribokinase family)